EDLFYTDLEVITIQQYFNPRDILIKQAATKSAFNQQSFNQIHCSHFSCHGYFNVNNPLQSALILANAEICTEIKPKVNNSEDYKTFPFRDGKRTDPSKCLTLENIFKLDLPLCRLVTLSACETGLTDAKSLSDEYIGLPSGFLFAGSPNVVSSLWTVSDLSTAFLMMKFYESLLDKNQHISVTVALKKAQKWLQKLTVQEYSNQLNNCQQIIEKVKQQLDSKEFQRLMDIIEDEQYRIKKLQVNHRLFQDPFYWAAFIAIGFN
ncbi:MAG: CHAT domain-containing protein, partial [Xenococcus sp. (in: cyanobacteria)]